MHACSADCCSKNATLTASLAPLLTAADYSENHSADSSPANSKPVSNYRVESTQASSKDQQEAVSHVLLLGELARGYSADKAELLLKLRAARPPRVLHSASL